MIVNLQEIKVTYLDVELDKGALRLRDTRHILIPLAAAWLNENEEIVRLGATAAELIASPAFGAQPPSAADEDLLRRRYAGSVTRSEEALAIGKRRRMVGAVQVRKRIETEQVEQAIPVTREDDTVERPPAAGASAEPTIGEEEIVVPVMAEEEVAEKRTVPVEEAEIKRAKREEKTVSADLQKERIEEVDRQ